MKLVSFISKSGDEVFVNPKHVSRLEMCATRPELYTEVYHPECMTLVQGRSHEVAHRLADEVVFPREVGGVPTRAERLRIRAACRYDHSTTPCSKCDWSPAAPDGDVG